LATDLTTGKTKSFWERKEGTTGMLFIAGLAVGGFFLAQAVLPSILALLAVAIAVVGKTIVLVGLCSALAALLFIITNKNFLTLLRYGFKSVMRKITSMFVEIDPIGIMKNYIEDLLEKYEVMKKNVNELKGRLNQLQTLITTNEKERQNQLMMAKRAHADAICVYTLLASGRSSR
jgi:hypothetical protein